MFSSLRTRLLLLTLLVVAPAMGLVFHNAFEQRRQAASEAKIESLRLARLIAVQEQQIIEDVRNLLRSLSHVPVLNAGIGSAECNAILFDFLRGENGFANLGVIVPDGRLVCSGLPMKSEVNLKDRDYFTRALKSREFAIGSYQVGRITGIQTINFGYPVFDAQGNPRVVIFAALDLSWLAHLLSKIQLPPGATVMLLDEQKTVLARYPEHAGWVGKSASDWPLFDAILFGGSEGEMETVGLDGIERLYGFAKLYADRGNRVYMAVGVPRAVVFAKVDRNFKRNLTLIGVIGLLIGLAAWFGAEWFVLRITRALLRAAREWSDGHFDMRTQLPYNGSEFGQLARAFDHMAEHLQQRQREIERINRVLRTLSAGNRTLLRVTEEKTLLRDMCRVVVEVGGYERAIVFYAQGNGDELLLPVAQAGLANEEFIWLRNNMGGKRGTEFGRNVVIKAMQSGELCIRHDTDSEHYGSTAVSWKDFWMIAFPLRVDGRIIGAFSIYTRESDAFDTQEVELLSENADDLAFGIQVMRMTERRREAENAVEQMLYHDTLTGLPNRLYFTKLVGETIAEDEANFTILLFDIDRFSDINDAIGYENGDLLLKEIGPRIEPLLIESQVIARTGEDEYAIFLPNTGVSDAVAMARWILKALEDPFMLGGIELVIHASIGIGLYPEHGIDPETLMRRVNDAMIDVKHTGGGCSVYVSKPEVDRVRQLALIGLLRRAIEKDQLKLYCQPKVDLKTGCVCGAEALLRWPNKEYSENAQGMIYPDEFIGLAEHTGLIAPLTYWVIETALCEIRVWAERKLDIPLAVNISARNLRDPRLIETIKRYEKKHGFKGLLRKLQLELTESALMEDPEGAYEVLSTLHHDMGIELYIDDFGTGYSSLAYLKKLPVTAIKIDRSFVMDMQTNSDSAAIVRSTIELAHNLERRVVAEGVEDAETCEMLKTMGCDEAQGYYFAKPMLIDEFPDWVSRSEWAVNESISKKPENSG
jgi:diguanylate cyclase (GGDEF)-like protein